MKLIKKSIFVVGFLVSMLACGWASEDAQKVVTDLVTQIQSIVKGNGSQDQYKPILLKYLDFDEISKKVLLGIHKEIKTTKDADVAKKEIDEFLPNFIPVFTDYMIKKYSKPEIIEKFRNMTFKIKNTSESGKYFSVNTTFESHSDSINASLGNLDVEWKTLDGKVVDMIFSDAAASIFTNERSEATAKYKAAGSLDGMLKSYN